MSRPPVRPGLEALEARDALSAVHPAPSVAAAVAAPPPHTDLVHVVTLPTPGPRGPGVTVAPPAVSPPIIILPDPIPAPGGRHHHHHHHHHVLLNGEVTGFGTNPFVNPDVGATHQYQGEGTVKPLGEVSVAGSLSLPGFVLHGKVHGTFTLTNTHGSVTVHVAGGPGVNVDPPGFVGVVTEAFFLQFTVVGGAGAYRGASGTGTATLTERTPVVPPPVPGQPQPLVMLASNFTLDFNSAMVHCG